MAKEVYEHGKQFNSIEQLPDVILAAWALVPDSLLQKPVDSTPGCIFYVKKLYKMVLPHITDCTVTCLIFCCFIFTLFFVVCCCLLNEMFVLPRHLHCQNLFHPEMFVPPGLPLLFMTGMYCSILPFGVGLGYVVVFPAFCGI